MFEYDPAHMIPPEELFEPEPAPAPAEPVVRNVGVHRYAPATQHSLSVRPSSDAGLSAHKAIVSAAPYRRAVVSGKGRLPTDDELAQFPRLVKEKWAPEPTKSKVCAQVEFASSRRLSSNIT